MLFVMRFFGSRGAEGGPAVLFEEHGVVTAQLGFLQMLQAMLKLLQQV